MNRASPTAFTLIELLVVITIIVVLLALLTPALDRAIHEAEMATCAARQRALGTTANLYASAFKRVYPALPGSGRRGGDGGDYQPWQLTGFLGGDVDRNNDMRLLMRHYMGVATFACPLTDQIDLSPESSEERSWTFGSYNMWFGYQFNGGGGMFKIGQRMSWTTLNDNDEPTLYRFSLMTSDVDSLTTDAVASNSHPDADGTMTQLVVENGDNPFEYTLRGGVGGPTGTQLTMSIWWLSTGHQRGAVDLNYGYADSSVGRIEDITYDEGLPGPGDMVQVPDRANNDNWPLNYINLPPG